jgi:hypothetical protein
MDSVVGQPQHASTYGVHPLLPDPEDVSGHSQQMINYSTTKNETVYKLGADFSVIWQ